MNEQHILIEEYPSNYLPAERFVNEWNAINKMPSLVDMYQPIITTKWLFVNCWAIEGSASCIETCQKNRTMGLIVTSIRWCMQPMLEFYEIILYMSLLFKYWRFILLLLIVPCHNLFLEILACTSGTLTWYVYRPWHARTFPSAVWTAIHQHMLYERRVCTLNSLPKIQYLKQHIHQDI